MVTVPNIITIARICLVPFFVIAFYIQTEYNMWIAAAVFALIWATDLLDGYLARRLRQKSRTGAVLDPIADKLAVMAALVMLTGRGVPYAITVIILFREMLITGLRALPSAKQIIEASVLGKLKMTSQMIAIMMALLGIPYSLLMLWVAAALSVISGIDYIIKLVRGLISA